MTIKRRHIRMARAANCKEILTSWHRAAKGRKA